MKLIILTFALFLLATAMTEHRQLPGLLRFCHYFTTKCKSTEFHCGCEGSLWYKRTQCIERSWVCDGWTDCGSGADELDCTCSPGEFQCNACNRSDSKCLPLFQCVPGNKTCDGDENCANSRDEYGGQCDDKGFQCGDGITLPRKDFCNGEPKCSDQSDELNCTCPSNKPHQCACNPNDQFCQGYICYADNDRCDGSTLCFDKSDELNCECPSNKPNRCACNHIKNNMCAAPGGICYADDESCDGYIDCIDKSDELNCECPSNASNRCSCNRMNNNTCQEEGSICYSDEERCDGYNDCIDNSDERNCECPSYDPNRCGCNQMNNNTCPDLARWCYGDNARCDTYNNCVDESDELNCTCSDDEFTCACFTKNKPTCERKKGCISKKLVNDENVDCPSGNDEEYIIQLKLNLQCGPCTLNIFRLEYEEHCQSPWCDKSTCFKPFLNSPTSETVSTHVICSSSNCSMFETSENCNKVLQCSDQTMILNYNFCNGRIDCEDESDEITNRPGFKCSSKASPTRCVLPQWNLHDDIAQCHDQSDLCFGKSGSFHCFRCLDERLIISSKQVCDGVIDCYDLSDECLCKNITVPMCTAIFSDIHPDKLQCNMNSSNCLTVNSRNLLDLACNSVSQCDNGIDESNCGRKISTIQCRSKWGDIKAAVCDSRPECTDFSDECVNIVGELCDDHNSSRPVFCNDSCHSFYPLGDRYCDGFIDEAWEHLNDTKCPRGFDERDCPKRFNCIAGKQINIDISQKCDGIADCDDESDEEENLCHDRFYCKSVFGNFVSIPKTLILNGYHDCVDGLDECPPSADSVFSSRQELLASLPLRIWLWIAALSTIAGNLYVIITTAMQLKSKDLNDAAKNNQILILNLSLADLLMGIYLLGIAIKTIEYSGSYCFYDYAWRSSMPCSGLGSLATISSETSCFVMVCLLIFRIKTVFEPFSVISTRSCISAVSLVWIISVFIATIPHISVETFIHGVWFPTQFNYPEVISASDVLSITCRLAAITNTSIEQSGNRWETVRDFLSEKFTQFLPKGEFGYYGATSVCMPRFYVAYGDIGWEYSIAVITINCICFLFVLIGYIIIYRHTSSNKAQLPTDMVRERTRRMQNRIARLIFTDFCCWVPICIIAYLKLAGVYIPDDVYAVSAVVLLPINSALNPLLYTPLIENLLSKISLPSFLKKPTAQ